MHRGLFQARNHAFVRITGDVPGQAYSVDLSVGGSGGIFSGTRGVRLHCTGLAEARDPWYSSPSAPFLLSWLIIEHFASEYLEDRP